MATSTALVGLYVVLNIFFVSGIVLGNKYLVAELGFEYMIVLSFFHFVTTALFCRIITFLGWIDYQEPKGGQSKLISLAVSTAGAIGFMNLNLSHNSVGFYQISKLVCIPITLAFQYVVYRKTTSTPVKATLVVLLAGVGLVTITDIELRSAGLMYACIGVMCTVLDQTFAHTKQKELGLDAIHLLYHSSPIIAACMLVLMPFVDAVFPWQDNNIWLFQFTWGNIGMIFLTCLFAVGCNSTFYLIVGKTSTITYQVVGHLKTAIILTAGYVFFHSGSAELKHILGLAIAFIGVVLYSEVKRRENEATKYSSVEEEGDEEFGLTEAMEEELELGRMERNGDVMSSIQIENMKLATAAKEDLKRIEEMDTVEETGNGFSHSNGESGPEKTVESVLSSLIPDRKRLAKYMGILQEHEIDSHADLVSLTAEQLASMGFATGTKNKLLAYISHS